MDASTVTSTTFQLAPFGGSAVAATVAYDAATGRYVLTPATALASHAIYTATVFGGPAGVKDVAGNSLATSSTWSFTTGYNVFLPLVVSTVPQSGATGVGTASNVRVTFNEVMDPETVSDSTFKLRTPDADVLASVVYDVATKTATLTPVGAMFGLVQYTVTVLGGGGGVANMDGGFMETEYAWSFTTGADTVAPGAPTGLKVTSVVDGITLDWNDSIEPDRRGYNVYRSSRANSGYVKLNATLLTTSGYRDTAAPVGTVSYYRVAVVDLSGNASPRASISAVRSSGNPPAAPTGLTATLYGSVVALDWANNPELDVVGYYVYRTDSPTPLNDNLITISSYVDANPPASPSYYAIAVNSATLESAASVTVNASQPGANLLSNPGFEADGDGDGLPDIWSSDARFTVSGDAALTGSTAGMHRATDNTGYTISQLVTSGVTAGRSYTFDGWVYVPATSDSFTLTVRLVWRDSRNRAIRTDVIRQLTKSTSGWERVLGGKVAPAGATRVAVQMVTKSLNATIFVDEFNLY
jgi:hypothetical protein